MATIGNAEEIRPGDTLTIRVVEWDAFSGTMQSWEGWPVENRVGADGSVMIPFVGTITASGTAPDLLSAQISSALMNSLSPSTLLGVTVAITERQPVYIQGIVRDAGAVPFREGMSVRQAIAVAGGILRIDQMDGSDLLRSGVTTAGQISQLLQREDELVARAARLAAVTQGATAMETPEFHDPRRGAEFLEREQYVFDLGEERRTRALSLIDSRVLLLENEINALTQRSEALEPQQEFAAEQLQSVITLSNQGLAANSRLLEAQRTLSTIELQILDVRGSLLSARQDISRAESDRLELVQGQATTALTELQSVLSTLDETRARRIAQEEIQALTGAFGPSIEELHLSLHRDNAAHVMEVTLDTLLEPGDIIDVALPVAP